MAPRPPFSAFTSVRLNPEDLALSQHPSVSTITFFSGPQPEVLAERVKKVLTANPWLAGRLWKSEEGTTELVVPATPSGCFASVEDSSLTPGLPMAELAEKLQPYLALPGSSCVNKAEAELFKVTLIGTGPQAFAVVVSMTHVLGDGATYFPILNSLGSDSPPVVLDPKRDETFGAAWKVAVGEDKLAFKTNAGLICGILAKFLIFSPTLLPKLQIRAWYVNDEYVAQQKTAHKAKVQEDSGLPPYVSTNDTLVSWFLSRGNYYYGLMALNFRGRPEFPNLSEKAAGNYMGELHYHPDMFASPGGIRKPLVDGLKTDRPPPSSTTNLMAHMGVASNWATFPFKLEFPTSEQLLHTPVFVTKGFFDALIIFQPMPGKLGVLVADRPSGLEQADPAVGQRIL